MSRAIAYVHALPRLTLDAAARLSITATCALTLILAGKALPF